MYTCNLKYIIEDMEQTNIVLGLGSCFNLGNRSSDKITVEKIFSDKVVLKLEKGENSNLGIPSDDEEKFSFTVIEDSIELELKVGDKKKLLRYNNFISPSIYIPISIEITNISEIKEVLL